jgi:hypothetical protein
MFWPDEDRDSRQRKRKKGDGDSGKAVVRAGLGSWPVALPAEKERRKKNEGAGPPQAIQENKSKLTLARAPPPLR